MDEHITGRGDRVTQRRLSEPRIARHITSMRRAIEEARARKEPAPKPKTTAPRPLRSGDQRIEPGALKFPEGGVPLTIGYGGQVIGHVDAIERRDDLPNLRPNRAGSTVPRSLR